MTESLLRMEKVTKRFSGVVANDEVDLVVGRGEVHALLGENGSGKTTLMNILYGIYQLDSGRILLRGEEVRISSPRHAIELGIGMVHQHFMLVPPLTVTENIVLGLPPEEGRRWNPLIDIKAAEQRIEELAARHGLDVDLKAKVWQLSVGAQQRVEILKALYREAEILILDEPTAVLAPKEVDELVGILRSLADSGRAIIFITHKLNEVMAVADQVAVLRLGKRVGDVAVSDTNVPELAELMVGRHITPIRKKTSTPGKSILIATDVKVKDDRGLYSVQGVSFTLAKGEILGVAGVDGNGQKELTEAIAGLRPTDRGKITIEDLPSRKRERVRAIGHVTEDRHHTGLVLPFSLSENFVLKSCEIEPYGSSFRLNLDVIRSATEDAIKEFDIRAPGPDVPIFTLSGGNQQKLILARELGLKPQLLLAAQPTRGLDVGAADYVHQRLIEARDHGMAVLLVSTELDEVLTISDRIMVIYQGRIMGIIDAADATREKVGLMMAGTLLEDI